jgi:CubicO group peptidase (beta-lactamase class C family)
MKFPGTLYLLTPKTLARSAGLHGYEIAHSIALLSFFMSSALLGQTLPTPQKPKPDFGKVRAFIQEQMATQSIPSITVAVARGNEILWEEGFGWADRQNDIKASAHTPYYLASVTKSLTGAALVMLQERGKLDLDRPVNDYLGAAKLHSPMFDPSQATVRRVATHTAGLTTYARECALDDAECRTSINTAIERYGVIFSPPGDHFDYSNLGYGILGDVISRVSGKTYGDFLNDEIFQPLGMSDCALEFSAELSKRTAAQYDQTSRARSPARSSDHPGASSEHCSVHDLALFGMFMTDQNASGRGQILSKESRYSILHSTVEAADGERYGIGWWMNPNLYGYEVFFGSGGTNDSAAALYLVPSEGLVVVALANTGTLLADQAAQETLATVLPKFREEREKAQETGKPKADTSQSTPPNTLAGTWTGEIQTWRGVVPLAFSIAPTREVHVTINSRDQVLQKASVEANELYGVFEGDVGTPDAPRAPYDLEVDVYLRGNRLVGAVTTRGDGPALPYWVTLQRAK